MGYCRIGKRRLFRRLDTKKREFFSGEPGVLQRNVAPAVLHREVIKNNFLETGGLLQDRQTPAKCPPTEGHVSVAPLLRYEKRCGFALWVTNKVKMWGCKRTVDATCNSAEGSSTCCEADYNGCTGGKALGEPPADPNEAMKMGKCMVKFTQCMGSGGKGG